MARIAHALDAEDAAAPNPTPITRAGRPILIDNRAAAVRLPS
jgi:hypothetical protein